MFGYKFVYKLARSSLLIASIYCSRISSYKMSTGIVPTSTSYSFLNSINAKAIDDKLMTQPGFTIDQLMELAGLSVASASHDFFLKQYNRELNKDPVNKSKNILVFCGPGNNGGDGLVAARHLKHFGYIPTVVYPKPSKGQLFTNLIKQCEDLEIPVFFESKGLLDLDNADLIIDGLFGFSFKGPIRSPFDDIITSFSRTKTPILSIDIPSGWDVEEGDTYHTNFLPQAVISLTLPKLCMLNYKGIHYLGGRFIPPNIVKEFDLKIPDYGFGSNQFILLANNNNVEKAVTVTQDQKAEIAAMLVTASSNEEAKKIASTLLEKKLIACVNFIPQIESMYEWEGKLETSQEVLMIIKTKKALTEEVTNEIKSLHSYLVPESIVLDVDSIGSNKDYINWVLGSSK